MYEYKTQNIFVCFVFFVSYYYGMETEFITECKTSDLKRKRKTEMSQQVGFSVILFGILRDDRGC